MKIGHSHIRIHILAKNLILHKVQAFSEFYFVWSKLVQLNVIVQLDTDFAHTIYQNQTKTE